MRQCEAASDAKTLLRYWMVGIEARMGRGVRSSGETGPLLSFSNVRKELAASSSSKVKSPLQESGAHFLRAKFDGF